MGDPTIKKPARQKLVNLENVPPEGKTFDQVDRGCWQTTDRDFREMVGLAGGEEAPAGVGEINKQLWEAFECEDHYVAVEKTEQGYFYIHRWRNGYESLGKETIAPFDPEKKPQIRNGFLLFPETDSGEKNFLVVPTHHFPFLNKHDVQAFYSSALLSGLAGEKLVKSFRLEPLNGAGIRYLLKIETAEEEYEPFPLPKYAANPPAPAPKPVPAAKPASLPPPTAPFYNPCDQLMAAGGGGMGRQIPVPRDSFYSSGFGKIGCGFQTETAGLEVFAKWAGAGLSGRGGLEVGLRYPERPMLRSSATLIFKDADGRLVPGLTLAHHLFLTPLRALGQPIDSPFVTVEQDLGDNDVRLMAGFQVMLPVRLKNFVEEKWDEKKTAAILADEVLLGASALNLGLNANELLERIGDFPPVVSIEGEKVAIDVRGVHGNSQNADAVAAGIGLLSGQMMFLDTMLWDAARKGQIAISVPGTAALVKAVAGGSAMAFSEHLSHGLLLNTALNIVQPLLDIPSDNPYWILGNALAGGALLVAYGRSAKESEWQKALRQDMLWKARSVLEETRFDSHLALAGTALLSYGLNLWLYHKGWSKF